MVTQKKTDAVECEFNVPSWVEWSEQDNRYNDVSGHGTHIFSRVNTSKPLQT